jgi:EAL domain-containing protein (putative c-di-GMP-specific phosphodiesterase class I)
MNQDEPFFQEVPGTIWEIEPRGDEWYFTRRYGEYTLENRRNIIGKSLFEVFPKGHPVPQKILQGIQSKKYFIFIESIISGRLYQNRCKPILDDRGNVQRVIGISIDITQSLSFQISLLDEASQTRFPIQTELDRSVEDIIDRPNFFEHFYLVYQPIINLRQEYQSPGWIYGVEALIRLKVEDRTILPGDFLPAIESRGLSTSLACWVIHKACEELGEIARQCPGFHVSINISIETLLDETIFEVISTALTQNCFPGDCLHLEILEISARPNIVEDVATIETIYRLRELGIKITIDDFGKQSSNFERLSLLAADDYLKIDRSFVSNQIYGKQASICTAIVWVGKVFQLRIIA